MKHKEVLDIFTSLSLSQQRQIERQLIDYMNLNHKLENTYPTICPCCHKKDTRFIKKGIQYGKQRYQCKSCESRFTYDKGTITAGMQISLDQLIEICIDTIRLVPIKQTAASLDLSIPTVFNHRHKFLVLLEEYLLQSDIQLSGTIEIDETYIIESTKGTPPENRKARHHGERSNYRGISHEQICIVTTTDRNAHEIFKAVGLVRPTTNSILQVFKNHIVENSIIYTDNLYRWNCCIR